MSGGLLQLVAYGSQDVFLTANPQITFFKVVYRRYTNFAMEAIEQTFSGTPDFGKKVSVTISRNGDLIGRMYLQCTLPSVTAASGSSGFGWAPEIGHHLIRSAEVEIGGQKIDKHYGVWLSIWNSLVLPESQVVGYNSMVGNTSNLVGTTSSPYVVAADATLAGRALYIPLQFWFCRNPGLYLPLIALQYHEVKVNIEFRTFAELHRGTASATPTLGDTSLFVDYVYLDTDERRRFAQVAHEYLIEQLQFTGEESLTGLSNKIRLNFNHPVKELVWVVQRDDAVSDTDFINWSNFTDTQASGGDTPDSTAKLQLNGHDRFSQREGRYFSLVQPYRHHTHTPLTGVHVYSFALKPEEHQPSGSVNMSRIDNATLQVNLVAGMSGVASKIHVFALSNNVLRILSGMAGLAYAS